MLSATSRLMLRRTAPALYPVSGKVVSWKNDRGFGFIEEGQNKKQVFVHYSALKMESGGFRALAIGQEVEFEIVDQDGRQRAESVTAPGGAPLPPGPRSESSGGGGGGGGGGFRGRGRGGGGGGFRGRGRGGQQQNSDFGSEF